MLRSLWKLQWKQFAARMKKGNALDKVICLLVSNPQRLLSVILVGNMFVNVLLTAICAALLSLLCNGSSGENGVFFMAVLPALQSLNIELAPEQLVSVSKMFTTVLNIAIVTPALIILGELTPKSVAYGNPTTMSRIAALPIKYLSRLILPIVWVLEMICKFLQKLLAHTGIQFLDDSHQCLFCLHQIVMLGL